MRHKNLLALTMALGMIVPMTACTKDNGATGTSYTDPSMTNRTSVIQPRTRDGLGGTVGAPRGAGYGAGYYGQYGADANGRVNPGNDLRRDLTQGARDAVGNARNNDMGNLIGSAGATE